MKKKKKLLDLIEQMTLYEKIGQLTQYGTSIYTDHLDFNEELLQKLKNGGIGSFLSLCGVEKLNKLQKIVLEETRLKIPLLFGHDIIHGYRTIFPVPIAEACSFEPELARQSCRVTAKEARANGIHITWAPMVDVCRDQRWGRTFEGTGEDVCVGVNFAKARVEGFQGDGIDRDDSIAACVKHFACYGAAEGGRDYNTVDMSKSKMYNVYFPTYRAAIEAGAAGVMTAFNEVNGVPCVIDKELLNDVLRDEMGFDGLVISDANSLKETIAHGCAEDAEEAVIKAVEAGLDIEMMSGIYSVLDLKDKLGLFDNPYADENKAQEAVLRNESIELSREIAKRCIVLLENNGILPLKSKKIAVIGKIAEDRESTIGGWVAAERKSNCKDAVTILEAMKNEFSPENISYAPAYDFVNSSVEQTEMVHKNNFNYMWTNEELIAEAVERAKDAEVILFVAGESQVMSGESESRADLSLPAEQERIFDALKSLGKPIITFVVSGRTLILNKVSEESDALLFTYSLGSQMGNAVMDVLTGRYNPSAKLVQTIPSANSQCPTMYYSHMNTGRPADKRKWWSSRYIDTPFFPKYCFGYGKSYTEFEIVDIVTDKENYTLDEKINICVKVKNNGKYDGEEVVQIYSNDCTASIVRPVKELKLFRKVFIKTGEIVNVKFELDVKELGFFDNNAVYKVESGKFVIFAGNSCMNCLEKEITVTE